MDNDEKLVQIRISVPENYRRLFKSLCAELGTDMSKRLTELMREDLIKGGKLKEE